MTEKQKQKKFEECTELLQELANVLTLVISSDLYTEQDAMSTVAQCLESMIEYDALTEEQKIEYEDKEEVIMDLFDAAIVAEKKPEKIKVTNKTTNEAKPKKALLN